MVQDTYVRIISARADELVETIAEIKDPWTRAIAAGRAREALAAPLAALRREAVLELRRQGVSEKVIAGRLGLHHSRIGQITRSAEERNAQRQYERRVANWKAAGEAGPKPVPPVGDF